MRASQSNALAAQVRISVGFGGGRNVVAFAIGDHQQTALFGCAHGIFKSLHARYAILLEERQLRFDGGDQVGDGIEHQFMKMR